MFPMLQVLFQFTDPEVNFNAVTRIQCLRSLRGVDVRQPADYYVPTKCN